METATVGIWTLKKQFRFEASHQLHNHDGKCKRLHGHSWVGWVEVQGREIETDGPKTNMLMDYGDLKALVKPLVDQYLDHHHLNDTLETDSPTSEMIAKWVYHQILPKLPTDLVLSVTIEETCTSSCTYRERESL